jgi:hypothetical protein
MFVDGSSWSCQLQSGPTTKAKPHQPKSKPAHLPKTLRSSESARFPITTPWARFMLIGPGQREAEDRLDLGARP